MKSIETEMKFIIPNRAVWVELRQLQQVDDYRLQPAGTKHIVDSYMDTTDQAMYNAGYACRIRTGKDSLQLTLKSLTTPDNNIHRREEIEMDIPSERIEDWPSGPASEMVGAIVGDKPLETQFRLQQVRYKYHVWLERREVFELSLDIVKNIDAGDADYFELEVELLEAGVEADLPAFVEALQRRWSLLPQPQSKFERAYAAYLKRLSATGLA